MKRVLEALGIERPGDWNERLFFPVLHLPDHHIADEAAWRETNIALEAGADGVFLISHGEMGAEELAEVWARLNGHLRSECINFPVGINWLDLTHRPDRMIKLATEYGISLIWSDAAGESGLVSAARDFHHYEGLYCGACAFKVGPYVPDGEIGAALDAAYKFMDVPVTSGPGTNMAMPHSKVQAFAEAKQGRPLGVASGTSMQNLSEMLEIGNLLFVASSLEVDWHHKDPKRVAEMAVGVKNWQPKE